MAGDKLFLYWGSGSIPCWKAMLVLEEKGFHGYKNKLCSFQKKEHKTDEILALNPRGQLPTFKDGDIVVNESNAIMEYLEATYSDQGLKLLPADPAGKAQVFQVVNELSNLQTTLNTNYVYYKFHTPKDKYDVDLLKERAEKCRTELAFWEARLKKAGPNTFAAGSTFTLADCAFFPYVAFAKRVGLQLEKWAAIEAYYKKIVERASVKATWPPHWTENPEGDKSILGDI
ncbi:glutathione S-transferase A-like [Gigantopelta aegis]|uniref:glutathione S-transferase A-like n=1 Tax=Gigantopelta aegis TaxID=1735272 RepID=UPI001B88E104|nr:glutathione S-transferase A-like [Gigantopelta aegis]